MKRTKTALLHSAIALLLCISMLIGSTFAWFSDGISSGNNIIQSGNLDIEMYWTDDLDSGEWFNVEDDGHNTVFNYDNWEPGYTDVKYIKLVNNGSLAMNYKLTLTPQGVVGKLAEVINVYFADSAVAMDDRDDFSNLRAIGLLNGVLNGGATASGTLLPAGKVGLHPAGETIVTVAMSMITTAGNDYQNENSGEFTITALATQAPYEQDSFGADYDDDAEYPVELVSDKATAAVTPVDGKVPTGGVTLTGANITAVVPAGAVMAPGADKLSLSVTPMEHTTSDIKVVNDEILIPVDVHIDGLAEDNTVPVIIRLGEVLPKYLNMGNYHLFHVEDGTPNEMTLVDSEAQLIQHNQFTYDPLTGEVTVAMATFSEVALVADTSKAWKGNEDYNWYNTTDTKLYIANADQLHAFAKIVGGMAKDGENTIARNSFSGKTVTLLSDINLNNGTVLPAEGNTTKTIFYPIGYNNNKSFTSSTEVNRPDAEQTGVTSDVYSFEGTFDGNGHTIANFYQNTWEMFGDYNSGYPANSNYYKDAMGLFGYVHGGTVKNLTVDNFESDGEFTPTGVIAAYADGNATFENIAITNCNPRVYNTGNGGIIGIAGDTSAANDDYITLKNITVDNSNKISALWGSYDVACGGLVGMYRGNVDADGKATGDTISFNNCHVSAIIDVYNDVCGNYQYYAYRYAGMIIGSVRHNTKNDDGKTIPNMTGISATGCTVNYGTWNDYYYCEFEKNSIASYSEDYQFSRVPHSELNFTDSNGNGKIDTVEERESVTGCKHTHTDEEDKTAVYLPFHQLFTGYSWGVSSIGLKEYSGIVTDLGITEGDQEKSVVKFETKFTGAFLYRVGNMNTFSIGDLFAVKTEYAAGTGHQLEVKKDSNVWVSLNKVDENADISGEFTPNDSDWTQGTIKFTGTGLVKITIQDYNFCTPTELIVEVVDATNLTSATGTTSGGNFVLLCDVNTSSYVYYWNATLYGNGFTYSLNGAPTDYSSSHGHGVIITKNATLDNLKIVGDVYEAYGAYTNQDYYNAAIDVLGETVIQNCYIFGCAAPVNVRSNVTIKNTTLYGGAVANLMIKSGTVTLEDVTTANYADGRALVGMGIVAHSDVNDDAKLIINGTLKQYNFVNENNIPSDSNAKILYNAMFDDACSQYHFETDEGKYVNTGIISMSTLFNASDITDNANTGYVGQAVTVSGVNGYVYTQPNTSGSVNNEYNKDTDPHVATTQGAVPPSYSFNHTVNYVAKSDSSNDYCYEENGTVHISMDEGETFDWYTSILTIGKGVEDYTVSMNGTDYTDKSISFNTAGGYEVVYTYTDGNNYALDANGNITTYSKTYTKTVNISVAVIEAATKHAEFTFGSSSTASTTVTIGNNTYVMPNVNATSSTIGSTTVSGTTIYYPIVEIVMSDGKTSHTSGWNAYFPVFSNAVTITDYKDNGTGDAETFGSDTQSMPSGLSIVGDPAQLFKYQSSSTAGTSPVVKNNILVYSSPSISAKRDEYNTVIQYSYQDNAGTTYYYYIGYHAPAQSYSSLCVTPDTLVTLADGTQKEIQYVTYEDQLLGWNLYEGEYQRSPAAYIIYHGDANYRVISLNFSDSTTVKIIGEHGFLDATTKQYEFIDEGNVSSYVGHRFVKQNGNAHQYVTLDSYSVKDEFTGAYSIATLTCSNAITNNIISVTPINGFEDSERFFNFVAFGDNMAFDQEALRTDVEKYGVFTYNDLSAYLTEEEFAFVEAMNGHYCKIAIEKGLYTMEEFLGTLAHEDVVSKN